MTRSRRHWRLSRRRPAPDTTTVETSDLIAWRRRRLLEAGFAPALSTRLASDLQRDLHALLQLVDRGCPPELAARILSPVREGVGR